MLEQTCREIYTKFKLNLYKNIFHTMDQSNNRLSATEAFSVEVIYVMKGPTIREFADFVNRRAASLLTATKTGRIFPTFCAF